MCSPMLLLAALCLCATRVCAETGVTIDAPTRILLGSAKKDKTKPQEPGVQQPSQSDAASSALEAAPEREMSASDIFSPTTAMPVMKIVGPVIGGVIGAGALAGVIAISVMKKPKTPAEQAAADAAKAAPAGVDDALSQGADAAGKIAAKVVAPPAQLAETTLTAAVNVGDTQIEIASATGFAAGDTIKVGDEYQLVKGFGSLLLDHPMNKAQPMGAVVSVINDVASTLPPTQAPTVAPTSGFLLPVGNTTAAPTSMSGSQPSSGSTQNTVLAIACVLVGCGLLAICVGGILCFFFSKKKKRKTQPRKETPFVGDYPEDQQPLNQQSQMSTRVDMPQQQDLCESQYMQVQVPPLQQQSYAVPNTGNLGSIPTMQNVVPMQTMPPPPPPPMAMSYAPPAQGGSLFSQGSYYQNASPLANTVNALPTTQFSQFAPAGSQYGQYGLPPTIY